MAAAALGRMCGAAREKLSTGLGARGRGALARSLVLALFLAPVLCDGNGRGETARDRAGPYGTERRRLTVVPTGRVPAARAGPGMGSDPSVISPGLRKWGVRFRDPSGWAGTGSGRIVDSV